MRSKMYGTWRTSCAQTTAGPPSRTQQTTCQTVLHAPNTSGRTLLRAKNCELMWWILHTSYGHFSVGTVP